MARASLDIRSLAWPVLLAVSGIGFSLSFACATPFVGLATAAALTMRRREAGSTILAVWLINQAVGFGFHHYPHTPSTVAWGATIGAAAMASGMMASGFGPAMRINRAVAGVSAFVSAFAVYESVLFAAALVLPGSLAAFAPPVMFRILAINAIAFGLFACLRLLARANPRIDAARA